MITADSWLQLQLGYLGLCWITVEYYQGVSSTSMCLGARQSNEFAQKREPICHDPGLEL